MNKHEQLYLIATVAKVLDSSTKSVRRKIAAGKLVAVRDNGRLKVKGGSLAQHINDMPPVQQPPPRPRPPPGRSRSRAMIAGEVT